MDGPRGVRVATECAMVGKGGPTQTNVGKGCLKPWPKTKKAKTRCEGGKRK